MTKNQALAKIDEIKIKVDQSYDRKAEIKKQIEVLNSEHRELNNYIARSEDDLDILELGFHNGKYSEKL